MNLKEPLHQILGLYSWAVLASIILSWIPNPELKKNPVVNFVRQSTEPLFNLVRTVVPVSGMGMDFAPLIVLILIQMLRSFLR